jgi:hypothetical protein
MNLSAPIHRQVNSFELAEEAPKGNDGKRLRIDETRGEAKIS